MYVCMCVLKGHISLLRPTKGMGAIMEERLKRRRQDKTVNWKEATGHQGNKSTPGAKLNDSRLVQGLIKLCRLGGEGGMEGRGRGNGGQEYKHLLKY